MRLQGSCRPVGPFSVGFLKWGCLQIIHFSLGLSTINHPFWDILRYPHVRKPRIYAELYVIYPTQGFSNQFIDSLLLPMRQPYTNAPEDVDDHGEAVHCTKYLQTDARHSWLCQERWVVQDTNTLWYIYIFVIPYTVYWYDSTWLYLIYFDWEEIV